MARTEERLRALQSQLPSLQILAADVLDENEMQRAIEHAQSVLGVVRSAAYCLGSVLLRPAHLTSTEQFEEAIRINLTGAFFALRSLAPVMAEQGCGGSILYFSSAAAGIGLPNHEAIAAAKGGLEAMVRAAAMSYAKRQVRVNAISAGLISTPLSKQITENETSLRISQALHPLGRIGSPDDLITAAEWIMGPSSGWMTGTVVSIDGGMRAGRL